MKILIIRFSSIGDIVLTTPVVRCLKQQKKTTIHYLIKKNYTEVLQNNVYIDKLLAFDKKEQKETIKKLQKENYDLIIDLQNNLSSFFIKRKLYKKTLTVNKKNIKKWLLVNTGKDLLKREHIVERYFQTIKKINVKNDQKGLDFFINPKVEQSTTISKSKILETPFIAWAIGATYSKKKISIPQIIEVLNRYDKPVVLLGGKKEQKEAEQIILYSKNNKIINFCGKLTLQESAFLVNKSELILTNDTGLMHIASAFKKQIISFWGCTKPSLGMAPYKASEHSVQLVSYPNSPPCSKLGNRCRKHKQACILEINPEEIYKALIKEN
ncbi:MAG: glycosyltransferase family 9 protein [Crocinitomicaceae bacterium]|nr:glycosyltransferase family 9 protein [Crocinitomicaceae bacterium]